MDKLAAALFNLSPDIRYVALYRNGELRLAERPGIANASASASDRYEELIVNPTLITLTKQRGDIDCGGLEFVVIRYGNFYQTVHPIPGGHLSVATERHANPLALTDAIRATAQDHGIIASDK